MLLTRGALRPGERRPAGDRGLTVLRGEAASAAGRRAPSCTRCWPSARADARCSIRHAELAALYRLSGTEPACTSTWRGRSPASQQPILHGLCSCGIAAPRGAGALCGNQPGAPEAVSTCASRARCLLGEADAAPRSGAAGPRASRPRGASATWSLNNDGSSSPIESIEVCAETPWDCSQQGRDHHRRWGRPGAQLRACSAAKAPRSSSTTSAPTRARRWSTRRRGRRPRGRLVADVASASGEADPEHRARGLRRASTSSSTTPASCATRASRTRAKTTGMRSSTCT